MTIEMAHFYCGIIAGLLIAGLLNELGHFIARKFLR